MDESEVDTGALPEAVSQQGDDQRRNRSSQTIANGQLPEQSNEPGRQWQPQNAQANEPNVEEKQSTTIRQPAGGEAGQFDPSHITEAAQNNLRQSVPCQNNRNNLARDEFGNIATMVPKKFSNFLLYAGREGSGLPKDFHR